MCYKTKTHRIGQNQQTKRAQEKAQISDPLVSTLRNSIKRNSELEAIIYKQRDWCRPLQEL